VSTDLLATAVEAGERWAILDSDPRTRGQLDALVDRRDPSLIELFERRLEFGTAGLRAAVGPGPNRMNAVVVRQTTVAVVEWLRAGGVDEPRMLIGYDARADSAYFAAECARSAVAAGARADLANRAVATPVVAHALAVGMFDAGVVITASHNPPGDNGYKLYLGDGMQIVAPVDNEISEIIDRLARGWHNHVARIDETEIDNAQVDVGAWLRAHRHAAVRAAERLSGSSVQTGQRAEARALRMVYTPLHGVGGEPVLDALAATGYPRPTIVEAQFQPDPTFPTVNFPNPEEPGALDDALALAELVGADVVAANDPDADRLAIAVRKRSGSGFAALSGDELGVLLGDYVLRHTSGDRVVARSIVSSRLLDAIARSAGVEAAVTLTGFKWLARSAGDYPNHDWVFGYEEAIGYAIGDHVRDKDGVTALLVALEMLGELSSTERTVWDRLDELAVEHGLHVSAPFSLRFADEPRRALECVERLTGAPPQTLGGIKVAEVGPIGGGRLAPTAGLMLRCVDDAQVIVRPSGTEPKLKVYIEVIERSISIADARVLAAERLAAITNDLRSLLEP